MFFVTKSELSVFLLIFFNFNSLVLQQHHSFDEMYIITFFINCPVYTGHYAYLCWTLCWIHKANII